MRQSADYYAERAKEIRRTILSTLYAAHGSFNGGSLSAADILTVLYHGYMRIGGDTPFEDRDVFFLSKGHCSSALYAALVSIGLMPRERLADYGRDGSTLGVHPKLDPRSGIEASSGSLGHGLPIAVGYALAARIQHKPSHIYVLMGDGECNEGSVWENMAFASRQKLDNLTVIVDRNRLQGCGRDQDILNYGDMAKKFEAFGFRTIDIDGHNYEELDRALAFANQKAECPTAIIANTVKGKGVSFMEDRLEWHYKSTTDEQYEKAMRELR